jgi:hypothetical protein
VLNHSRPEDLADEWRDQRDWPRDLPESYQRDPDLEPSLWPFRVGLVGLALFGGVMWWI